MTLIVVVLPDPLGPINPRISPGCTAKLTPSTARKPAKSFVRSRTINASPGALIDSVIESLLSIARVEKMRGRWFAPAPPEELEIRRPGWRQCLHEGRLAVHDLDDEGFLFRNVPRFGIGPGQLAAEQIVFVTHHCLRQRLAVGRSRASNRIGNDLHS